MKPTPELLKEWDLKATAAAMSPSDSQSHDRVMTHRRVFATLAAQWGAEQSQAEIERLTDINRDALSNLNDLADQKNAEIERLTAELKAAGEYPWAALDRKDALLRECLEAFDAVAGKGKLCNAAIANINKELGL